MLNLILILFRFKQKNEYIVIILKILKPYIWSIYNYSYINYI